MPWAGCPGDLPQLVVTTILLVVLGATVIFPQQQDVALREESCGEVTIQQDRVMDREHRIPVTSNQWVASESRQLTWARH